MILFLIAPASNSRPIEKIIITGQIITGRNKQKSSNKASDPILNPATKLKVNATAETTQKNFECKYLDNPAFMSLTIVSTSNKVDEVGFQIFVLLMRVNQITVFFCKLHYKLRENDITKNICLGC